MHLLDKLEFGGQWPLTMRARCYAFRYCPDPLGIVTAEQLDKLEFGGESPRTIRARCSGYRYCRAVRQIGIWRTNIQKSTFLTQLYKFRLLETIF